MPATLNLTEAQTLAAMRGFLQSILPFTSTGSGRGSVIVPAVEIVQGQINRVPEPAGADYIVITPMMRTRLATNIDTYNDGAFEGSIAGTELIVSTMLQGYIAVGQSLLGAGIIPGTFIQALGTGSGGVGTYVLGGQSTPSQIIPIQPMFAGSKLLAQPTQVTVQIDVHGPNSADYAQIISTAFRDDYACRAFADTGLDVDPLYADDPKQLPFWNAEDQAENRWSIDAQVQANPIVQVDQQFAAALVMTLIEADQS